MWTTPVLDGTETARGAIRLVGRDDARMQLRNAEVVV
jgi:hypothetical protein